MKITRVEYEKKCVVCATEFVANRNDAKYCTDRCRMQYKKHIEPTILEAQKKEIERIKKAEKQKELEVYYKIDKEIEVKKNNDFELEKIKINQKNERKILRTQILCEHKKMITIQNFELQKEQAKESQKIEIQKNELIQENNTLLEKYTEQLEKESQKIKKLWENSAEYQQFLKRNDMSFLGILSKVLPNVMIDNSNKNQNRKFLPTNPFKKK